MKAAAIDENSPSAHESPRRDCNGEDQYEDVSDETGDQYGANNKISSNEIRIRSVRGEDISQALVLPAEAATETAISPKKVLRVRPDGKLTSPKSKATSKDATPSKKKLRARSDGKLASPETKSAAEDAVPTKKTLRVCPDGKLTSPKATEAPQDMKPKRGRKSTKTGVSSKTMMAIIRYGTDEASRSIIGNDINYVLSGKRILSVPSIIKPFRPVEPPKATHPFFLGPTVRIPSRRSSLLNEEQQKLETDAETIEQRRKTLNPRKARVTSKPAEFAHNASEAIACGSKTFGSDLARVCRFPGAVDPMWPPLGMLHVRPEMNIPEQSHLDRPQIYQARASGRKMKGTEIKVLAEEEVLRPWLNLIDAYNGDKIFSQKLISRDWREFRRPCRRLMTGHALQKAVHQEMSTRVPNITPHLAGEQDIEELSASQTYQPPSHKALRYVFERIPNTFSAFDRFECETQDWVHKYAPRTAESVLQQGQEVILLRDWLENLKVTSVDSGDGRARDPLVLRKFGSTASKRKRKRAEELDGFVISSDEEANQMDEITDLEDNGSVSSYSKKSTIRGGNGAVGSSSCDRSANAVVISGPNGCGKTAAVYAVAQEIGFEVFEINAGSRRNGKDILDKVGDMTRNHQVRHVPGKETATSREDNEALAIASNNLKQDLESGRQGTMNNFFKASAAAKKKPPSKISKPSPKKEAPKKQRNQKQSLILLEEVDVLFEEDKLFWATTLDLILQSKRPVIMTCTDEDLLPLNDMVLQAILRFTCPPEQLASDYLLLVAGNEGHLLSGNAVSSLYRAKGSDLRASIAELNFYCQMAVGDTKGGLEWMLMKSPTDDQTADKSESLRVVSDGTYQPFMGWFGGEVQSVETHNWMDRETELLSEIWNGWGIDIGDSAEYLLGSGSPTTAQHSRAESWEALIDFDQAAEALSASDTFPAYVCRQPNSVILDPVVPDITEKARSDYVEGPNVLLADPFIEYKGVADSLSLTLRSCAKNVLYGSFHSKEKAYSFDKEQSVARALLAIQQQRLLDRPLNKLSASVAFEPIARAMKPVLGIPKGPQISSLDGPMSVIAEDLAPYLRNIVAYDLKLEEQRRQLDSLLSGPGKHGKKGRTTRSARAALEGGQKAYTRRERWFPTNTKFSRVLQTGGKGWQDALERNMIDTSSEVAASSNLDGSGRSSVGSDMESDI